MRRLDRAPLVEGLALGPGPEWGAPRGGANPAGYYQKGRGPHRSLGGSAIGFAQIGNLPVETPPSLHPNRRR